jgi:methylmalonyl-CoA mutase
VEALAAVMGHTQSLHTNSLDEAVSLPTDFSARIARNTQLYLQNETGICQVIDPWGGSYYVEALTNMLMKQAWTHIEEVESLGGMVKAITTGVAKTRIEEAAARRQALIDSGQETIVGVNCYPLADEQPMEYLEIDNTNVRQAQIKKLTQLRKSRDDAKTQEALNAITTCAETKQGNLLSLAINAARARASLGEISHALEKVFRRYQPVLHSISGVYIKTFGENDTITTIRKVADGFEKEKGRRPRIMIAKMGQDGHDRGAKVIATAFADMGFDVDIGPLFQTPEEVAYQAVENDVHVVGMSTLAGGHKTLLPHLVKELANLGRDDIIVIAGGVIPVQDYGFLQYHGAKAVFGPGTKLPEAAMSILEFLKQK